jgi:hypothetical protein
MSREVIITRSVLLVFAVAMTAISVDTFLNAGSVIKGVAEALLAAFFFACQANIGVFIKHHAEGVGKLTLLQRVFLGLFGVFTILEFLTNAT